MRLVYAITIAVLVLGWLLLTWISTYVRHSRLYVGYAAMADEIRVLARGLGAEVVRRGQEITLVGRYQQWPVRLRFSLAKSSPGLRLEMSAPLTFAFSVVPRWAAGPRHGRLAPRAFSGPFNARFVSRTSDPLSADMFLEFRQTASQVERLCCSTRTFLVCAPGSIELIHVVIPRYAAFHILKHVVSMSLVASAAAEMPGAHGVQVRSFRLPQESWVPRAAIALGGVAALFMALGAYMPRQFLASERPVADAEEGSPSSAALKAPLFKNWRVAESNDFDPLFLDWLLRSGQEPAARVKLETARAGTNGETAYLLMGADGSKRVVLLRDSRLLYDTRFIHLAGIAKVPHEVLHGVAWLDLGQPQEPPENDGLLVVRDSVDPASAYILFVKNNQVYSGVPRDYREIAFR